MVAMTREDGLDKGEVCDFAGYVIRRGLLETSATSFLKNLKKCLERRVISGLFLKGSYGHSLQVMVPILVLEQS